jgi:hypothetical protein
MRRWVIVTRDVKGNVIGRERYWTRRAAALEVRRRRRWGLPPIEGMAPLFTTTLERAGQAGDDVGYLPTGWLRERRRRAP